MLSAHRTHTQEQEKYRVQRSRVHTGLKTSIPCSPRILRFRFKYRDRIPSARTNNHLSQLVYGFTPSTDVIPPNERRATYLIIIVSTPIHTLLDSSPHALYGCVVWLCATHIHRLLASCAQHRTL